MNSRKLLIVGTLVIASGWVGFWMGQRRLTFEFKNWRPAVVLNKSSVVRSGPEEVDFSLFWTVWDKVSAEYVDKSAVDGKKMVDGAISGMVSALGDPYTVYLPAQQNKESKEDLGGAFEGVGIQLGYKDNRLAIVAPLDGTPAHRAGVKAGDFILHIKDEKKRLDRSTDGLTLPEAVKMIRGEGGTTVELTLARAGQEDPFKVELTREIIVVKSVTVEYPDSGGGKIAWIKLNRFGDRTREEWNAVVGELADKEDIDGVVLDLRNNPGGYLEMSVYIAGEFLSPGKTVVGQQYGDGTKTDTKVDRNGRLLKQRLAVLVNEGSASASEILAGALQDHKRAKVVGVKSFGKGSVQQPDDFPDGSGVHITIAKWLRPSGEWIDKIGITPDEVVEWEPEGDAAVSDADDPQLKKAIELIL
ncbi:MAG: Carboxyl-terminal protease [Candidatus Amesbacteria bacterium GW2011_GWC1_47_15]|uniref:Carboxyl-terminal protease n=1 Tax=Candidatus Amesbacteria bacterium GW2011_GWC1_47_15 TaxID=1618364 RepID=A0A0G1UCM6_9BACT|nr:MAG: Carboxyl-terminal protease [Candidatus Amesbacteria bacterium GW2011_GWC1_47_15]